MTPMKFQHHEQVEELLKGILTGNHDPALDEGFQMPEAVTYYFLEALEQAQQISEDEISALVRFWRRLYVDAFGFCEAFSECKMLQLVEAVLIGRLDIAFAKSYLQTVASLRHTQNAMVLVGVPQHGNLGDHAILLGTEYLLQKCYPEHPVISLPEVFCFVVRQLHLPLPIPQDACIFLHGGGNFGTLYPFAEANRRWAISTYHTHRIVQFPQSIFFAEDAAGREVLQESRRIYQEATDLTIFERDEISYARGKRYFPTAKHQLVPDFALSLEARVRSETLLSREGVCFFLRKDKEKAREDAVIDQLVQHMEAEGIPYQIDDTVIDRRIFTAEDRDHFVMEKIRQAARARMVITDRYHGTIFSVITHTPVMAFRSQDTKIVGGLRWFRGLDWVYDGASMDEKEREAVIDRYCLGEWSEVKTYSRCGQIAEEAVRHLGL